MRRITALWESFFSKGFYQDVFYRWKGIGATLILLLVVIQTVVAVVSIHVSFNKFTQEEAPKVVSQIPAITFKNGQASTPEPIRYEIKDPSTGEVFAIIDTREPLPPDDLGGARMFVAGTRTTMKKSDIEQRTFEYKEFEDFTLDQTMINSWIGFAERFLALLCFPFIFGFLLVWRFIQLIAFSLVALAICAVLNVPGTYAAKLRLTAAALTPALLLTILCIPFGIDFFGIRLVFGVVVFHYILFGAFAVRPTTVAPPPIPSAPAW